MNLAGLAYAWGCTPADLGRCSLAQLDAMVTVLERVHAAGRGG